MPDGWTIATGLEADLRSELLLRAERHDPQRLTASGGPAAQLALRRRRRAASARVPADCVSNTVDTTGFVDRLRRMVSQAVALFGRAPYREFTFLVQDGAYGALKHLNSVTLGIPSADLARNVDEPLEEIAHEYFHAWNIMRIRPAEYPAVTVGRVPGGLRALVERGADDVLRRSAAPAGRNPGRAQNAYRTPQVADRAVSLGAGRFASLARARESWRLRRTRRPRRIIRPRPTCKASCWARCSISWCEVPRAARGPSTT